MIWENKRTYKRRVTSYTSLHIKLCTTWSIRFK